MQSEIRSYEEKNAKASEKRTPFFSRVTQDRHDLKKLFL